MSASSSDKLVEAARDGDLDAICRLLDAGADPNGNDSKSRTPLTMAAGRGQLDAMGMLIARGADLNRAEVHESTFTPFLKAAMSGQLAAVQLLVRLGANQTDRSGGGLTALQLAKEGGHGEVVDYLKSLKAGSGNRRSRAKMPTPTPGVTLGIPSFEFSGSMLAVRGGPEEVADGLARAIGGAGVPETPYGGKIMRGDPTFGVLGLVGTAWAIVVPLTPRAWRANGEAALAQAVSAQLATGALTFGHSGSADAIDLAVFDNGTEVCAIESRDGEITLRRGDLPTSAAVGNDPYAIVRAVVAQLGAHIPAIAEPIAALDVLEFSDVEEENVTESYVVAKLPGLKLVPPKKR